MRATSCGPHEARARFGCRPSSTRRGMHESTRETKNPPSPCKPSPPRKQFCRQTVTAQAVLFPLQQAAITPKISAPVQQVLRQPRQPRAPGPTPCGPREPRPGGLEQENKGNLEQAQAAYETTTGANLPEDLQKAQLDMDAAKKMLDAQEKVYTSRQELFQARRASSQGTGPGGGGCNASPQSIRNRAQALRSPAGHWQSTRTEIRRRSAHGGQGQVHGRRGAAQLLRNPQPDQRLCDRASALPRRNGRRGHCR